MPQYQLRATEKINHDIEARLRMYGLYYERRGNHYKSEGKPIAKIVEHLYLAQAVIAMLLRRPDDARARPSSVLNSDYSKVFTSKQPLDMYAACALMMKAVDAFLKAPTLDLQWSDRLNIRFYVAMAWASMLTGKSSPNARELAKHVALPSNSSSLDDAYKLVLAKYQAHGGGDQIAKGTDLLKSVRIAIEKQLVDA